MQQMYLRMERSQKQVLRQYGWLAETMPDELNVPRRAIQLSLVPYDHRALLFRDMGFGRRLFTLDMAEELVSELETLTEEGNMRLQERIRAIKPSPSLDPIDEYFMLHKN